MPSTAEAFGMMAIEAMACGKPIIVFEGTSLPDVTFAPEVGISVPMRNSKALCKAIEHLLNNPSELKKRGQMGRIKAEEHYDQNIHVQRMVELYKMVAKQ